VRAADGGDAGLACVSTAPPALVVTDVHMPGTSGAIVINVLKQRHPDIPIIAISGLFESGFGMNANDVVALGASFALAKPFKRNQLLGVVAQLLSSRP
jgi:CheY-like chemotaxis protein